MRVSVQVLCKWRLSGGIYLDNLRWCLVTKANTRMRAVVHWRRDAHLFALLRKQRDC